MENTVREYSQELLVHFDVADQRLTIDEFYQTAITVRTLTDVFNKVLFENQAIVGVYIRPPKPGGVVEVLDLVVKHPVISWVVAQYGAQFLEGILKDITGKDVTEIGSAFSAETRQFLRDLSTSAYNDYQKLKVDIPVGLELLKGSVENFLLKEPKHIVAMHLNDQIPVEAFNAKSKFYTMCARSGKIRGIGFSKKHYFPITQQNFQKYIQPEIFESINVQTRYELHEVTIVAPVNVADSNVQWKTEDKYSHKKLSFYMVDNTFRKEFLGGLYPLKETNKDDEMLVQIEYIITTHPNGKKSERRQAIKVFRFNNRVLATVPKGIKLNVPTLTANPQQGELFDTKIYEK